MFTLSHCLGIAIPTTQTIKRYIRAQYDTVHIRQGLASGGRSSFVQTATAWGKITHFITSFRESRNISPCLHYFFAKSCQQCTGLIFRSRVLHVMPRVMRICDPNSRITDCQHGQLLSSLSTLTLSNWHFSRYSDKSSRISFCSYEIL